MSQIVYDFLPRGDLNGGQSNIGTFLVKSGTTASIATGDLIIEDAGNPGYVMKAANGADNTATWVGCAMSASDETVGADGSVDVAYSPIGLLVEGTATTPGNLAIAVNLTRVTLDVDGSGNQTVDENDTANGFLQIQSNEWDATTGRVVVALPAYNAF